MYSIMSKDCLATVYKKAVDNNSLPEFGVVSTTIPNTGGELTNLIYIGGNGVTINIDGGSLYSSGNNPLSMPYELNTDSSNLFKYSATADAKLSIGKKYKLKYININYPIKLEDFAYCEGLTDIISTSGNAVGNLSSVSRLLNLNIFRVYGTADNKADVYGSVINLVNAAFDGSGAKIDVKYSGIDGDWLDFIRTRHSNSKSLGMIITSLYNNVKFNGKSCQIDNASITYVSNNKMALVSTGNNRVYTLGYTDEEIATNTAAGGVWAGKTVIKND